MLRSIILLTVTTAASVQALVPRQNVQNGTTTAESVRTITVVPVSEVSSASGSSAVPGGSLSSSVATTTTFSSSVPSTVGSSGPTSVSTLTKVYTSVDEDGSTVTDTAEFEMAVTTRPATLSLSYLHTNVTYLATKTYWDQYPPDMLSGPRCQYYGIQCPEVPVYPASVQSLISSDSVLSLSQCSATLNPSVTADATSVITTVRYSQPDESPYTQILTRTKEPWEKGGCCGSCLLVFPNVDVYYFPPDYWGTTQCVPVGGTAPTSPAAAPTGNSNATYVPSGAVTTSLRGSTFVNSNGYTFVSPSVYVAFTSVTATDNCGQVGKAYNNFTLAFAPGELMTEFRPLGGFKNGPAVDTWSWDVNSVTCGDRPILAFPDKLRTAVDPAWSICTASPGAEWSGNDPPFVLTPQAVLAAPTSLQVPSPTPAQPQSAISPPGPVMTSVSNMLPQPGPSTQSSISDATSAMSENLPNTSSPADSQSTRGPPTNVSVDVPDNNSPQAGNTQAVPSSNNGPTDNPPFVHTTQTVGDPPSQSNTPPGPTITEIPITTTDPSGHTITSSIFSLIPPGGSPAQGQQDPGAQIASQIGAEPMPQPGATSSPQVITLLGGRPATVLNPSAIAIDGTTLFAGAAAATIDGATISIAPSGIVINGVTSSFSAQATAAPSVIVVAPGTTLTNGGSAATVSGTVYSLGTGGLVVGGSTTMSLMPTVGSGNGTTIVTGAATRRRGYGWWLAMAVPVGVWVL